MKKTFAALAVAALFATAASAATFKAGTYTASAPGIHGAVTVEVTFTADKISAVKVVKQTETQGIGTLAVDHGEMKAGPIGTYIPRHPGAL